MACNCGKNKVRPAWQPRGKRAQAAAQGGSGTRVITSEERAAELANGRPARASQPGGR